MMRELKSFVVFMLALFPFAAQAQDYTKYLFAYFPSNSDENIYFAIADKDAPYSFEPINGGHCVVSADSVTVMNGLRDPHLMRGEDGYFYMVATDMRCALGWSSNRGIVMMRSKDLVHWKHHYVHFPDRYAGTSFANVTRVWAPETIWNPQAQRYMVYFSLLTNDGAIPYDRVYYCYANDDFSDLEGEPEFLFDRGKSTIDMDIVYNEKDGLYHAIYKNEGDGGICMVTAPTLTPSSGAPGSQWSAPSGSVQQTNVAVEGGGLYKLIGSDRWVLMYDCYGSGYYQFCTSEDLQHFTLAHQTATSGTFTPRHGSVMPITEEEYEALTGYWVQKAEEAERATFRRQLSDAVRHAEAMHVDVADARSILDDASSSSALMLQAQRELHAAMENSLSADYALCDFFSASSWPVQYNVTQRSGQHWNGGSGRYYEQNNGWGNKSWNMSMRQEIVLPQGDYVLKAACRSASTAVEASLVVDDDESVFPTNGDRGYGITTSGETSWNESDAFCNQGYGRGWEWRYVPFRSDGKTAVAIGVKASVVNAAYQWMSVSDFALYRSDKADGIGQIDESVHLRMTLSEDGALTVYGVQGKNVNVCDANGVIICTYDGAMDSFSLVLPKGVYMVTVGGKTLKVAM